MRVGDMDAASRTIEAREPMDKFSGLGRLSVAITLDENHRVPPNLKGNTLKIPRHGW